MVFGLEVCHRQFLGRVALEKVKKVKKCPKGRSGKTGN